MIEVTVRDYLEEKLGVPVYMKFPPRPPESFLVIQKTGSSKRNYLCTATMAIQSVNTRLYAAAQLNEQVKAAMESIRDDLDEIVSASLNSDYDYTDPSMKRYKYQAVFVVVHY
ncbi:hypothetical protein J2S20_002320 [Moryella indoligenes]|uniref:Phage protein n=1 Tax=Moryella indoligenes TaxID=371674 RepID=A0AAE3VC49_9FIRM|nr:hypothetical protein [Moryella indoligenes]MDQ0153599.1 hypothetical protein [Moryella indoligenes]